LLKDKEASGHPEIKTEEMRKTLPRVVVIKDYNEVDADAIIRTLKSIDIEDFGHISINTATKEVDIEVGEDAVVVEVDNKGVKEILFNGEKLKLPKILKTEELSKKPVKVVKIEDVGEVVVDEDVKDIRVKINDVIVKIVYNSSGLTILVDDEVVYKNVSNEEMGFCDKCGHELIDTILFAVLDNKYDFIDDKLCFHIECPNCGAKFLEEWRWVGKKEE